MEQLRQADRQRGAVPDLTPERPSAQLMRNLRTQVYRP